MNIERYYKKRLTNQNIAVEYSSEDNQVVITIDRKLKNGELYDTDIMYFDASYAAPLAELLLEVTKDDEVES